MSAPAIQQQPRERRHLPISFSDPLIPRVLDLSKWQTRRIMQPQPEGVDGARWVFRPEGGFWFPYRDELGRGALDQIGPGVRCPYGEPGDLLWVREGLWPNTEGHVSYASGHIALRDDRRVQWPWKVKRIAPRYCPRWASRIGLEVTEVRVQRVTDITDADALAEGVTCLPAGTDDDGYHFDAETPMVAFSRLWDEINGKRPGCAWADSPWVWCISFRQVRP